MRKINLLAERDFENRKASGEPVRWKQSKFYWATNNSIEEHKGATNFAIKDKHVLEIGCASGNDASSYCQHAASYVGIDISDVAISNCQNLQLKNATFHCVDGHILPLQDGTVDFVIVNSLLHHLDLRTVFKEIARVLKNDGSLIFREPLGTNFIFQFYRLITPSARTVDERPFTFSDIKLLEEYFIIDNVNWFGFISLLSAFVRLETLRRYLTEIDRILSKTPMKYCFWQISGIVKLRSKMPH